MLQPWYIQSAMQSCRCSAFRPTSGSEATRWSKLLACGERHLVPHTRWQADRPPRRAPARWLGTGLPGTRRSWDGPGRRRSAPPWCRPKPAPTAPVPRDDQVSMPFARPWPPVRLRCEPDGPLCPACRQVAIDGAPPPLGRRTSSPHACGSGQTSDRDGIARQCRRPGPMTAARRSEPCAVGSLAAAPDKIWRRRNSPRDRGWQPWVGRELHQLRRMLAILIGAGGEKPALFSAPETLTPTGREDRGQTAISGIVSNCPTAESRRPP